MKNGLFAAAVVTVLAGCLICQIHSSFVFPNFNLPKLPSGNDFLVSTLQHGINDMQKDLQGMLGGMPDLAQYANKLFGDFRTSINKYTGSGINDMLESLKKNLNESKGKIGEFVAKATSQGNGKGLEILNYFKDKLEKLKLVVQGAGGLFG